MSKFKRVLAFLGCVLVLLSTLALSVFADGQPSDDFNIWNYGSKSSYLIDLYGRSEFTRCYQALKTYEKMTERGQGNFPLLFGGGKNNLSPSLGRLGASVKISQQYVRGFDAGYRSNLKVGSAVLFLRGYNSGYNVIDTDADLSDEVCDVYYDLRYDGNTYLTFMLTDNLTYRSVEFLYVPMNLTVDPDKGYKECTYSLHEVRFNRRDGVVATWSLDDDKFLGYDISVLFMGNKVTAPDYVLNELLCKPYTQSYGTNRYDDMWFYPDRDVEAMEYAFAVGVAECNRDYEAGYSKGQTDGIESTTTFGQLVISIFEAPVRLIDGMLDFDIFGVNVAGLVKVLLTLSVTAAILFAVLKITRG